MKKKKPTKHQLSQLVFVTGMLGAYERRQRSEAYPDRPGQEPVSYREYYERVDAALRELELPKWLENRCKAPGVYA